MVFDSKTGKLNFSIYLNKFFRIVGGYVTFDKLKTFVHISEKKALVFDLSDVKFRGNLKHFLAIEFLQLRNSLILSLNRPTNAIIGSFAQVFASTLMPVLKNNKDFMEVGNSTTLWENDRNVMMTKVTACFNVLTLIIIFFRIKFKGKNKDEQSN